MKLRLYAALISAMMLFSFASFAKADLKSDKYEKSTKAKKQVVSGNKTAANFSFKSSAYQKDGLVKKKRYKKGSCPVFD
ncbi:hypothetical protein [Pontibacter sp. HSC-36F09]|uniref:hypothetical protein n=1 Tax=Pontibacter sp. HSC-36F09 TaxID=2910966 RepID=UPI0020A1085F|nr:hypothetical protein [Pontibacter sp. HSC-36F09]MCP2043479.1 hypothetical protein [Pontibacter sp. HSC-36F09]